MITAATSAPVLRAATPQEWLATHLEAQQSAHDEPGAGPPRWIRVADLLADGRLPGLCHSIRYPAEEAACSA